MYKYSKTDSLIKKHNDNVINAYLKSDKDQLDSILKKYNPNINLDDEQRKVMLSDKCYILVIASAGAGKTTTIEAKVAFCQTSKNAKNGKTYVLNPITQAY